MNEATKQQITGWLAENGYTVYADYRDEIPHEWVAQLLEGDRDGFNEKLADVGQSYFDYIDWDDWRGTILSALKLPDDLADDPELDELIVENTWIDTTDWVRTAARNTRLHITATPYTGDPLKAGERIFEEDQDERLLLFPHSYCDEQENARRLAKVQETLGIQPDADTIMYEFDELKVLGTLNVAELIEKGPPTHLTISPGMPNTIVTHNAVNGSGGLGDIKPTKKATFPAMFEVDNGNRYGVDAVYGFVGEVWAQELPAEWL